jgi:DnaJ-domain-containing protein 1
LQRHDLNALADLVLDILESSSQGLSEYALINALKTAGHPAFQASLSGDKLTLFRVHFLLFHVLYTLRERLWLNRHSLLEIGPLRITLHRYNEQASEKRHLARRDPLHDYYMNADHLDNTSAQEVEKLMSGFWSQQVSDPRRRHALEVLGLQDPVDADTIRRHYRRLVMRHHPDRGGQTRQLQSVNAAMAYLQRGGKR